MKRTSLKRKKSKRDWRKMSDDLQARCCGYCEVCGRFIGTLEPPNIHHVLPRSKGGKDDVGNLLAVCWVANWITDTEGCHEQIHTNAIWAKAKGYLK